MKPLILFVSYRTIAAISQLPFVRNLLTTEIAMSPWMRRAGAAPIIRLYSGLGFKRSPSDLCRETN